MTRVAVVTRVHVSASTLRTLSPEDEFTEVDPRDSLEPAAEAEVAIGGWIPAEVTAILSALPRLRWFSTVAAGVEGFVTAGIAARPGLVLTNNSGAYDVPIAEHVLALMLAGAKRLRDYGQSQTEHRWSEKLPHSELRDATLVIYGMGAIGGELARLASCLGMRVIGVRRTPGPPPPGVERVVGQDALGTSAAEADFLAIAAPLTSATRGSISAEVLGLMKPTAWIVNIARGAIIDERALTRALREGCLGGAALDVVADEPLQRDSELWTLPNVIITPHVASSSPLVAQRTMSLFVDNLRRWKRGERLTNVVDASTGY
jgi:phosphoglycerate dehydrogenase-like enzyme